MAQNKRLGRITISIYNSYDPVNFREAHRRILARAGPLALRMFGEAGAPPPVAQP